MSLINDALKDLDSRRDTGSIGAEKSFAQPTICADEENSTAAKLSYGVFLVLCGIGGALVYDMGEPLRKSEAAPVVAEVFSIEENSPVDATALVSESVVPLAVSIDVATPAKEVETETSPEDEVSNLVDKAREALTRNRLTLPEKGSAIYYLSQLKMLDTGLPEVLSIEGEVKARYQRQISFAIESDRLARANFLIGRGDIVGLSEEVLTDFRERITQKQNASDMLVAKVVEKQVPARESWVTETLETRENTVIGQARNLLSQGENSQAIAKVKDFLQEQPEAFHTRVFLFDLYMNQNKVDSAQALLEEMSHNHTLTSYFQAQLINARSGPESAIPLLEGAAADPRISHKHDALLAAMYQKAGRHQDAVGLYTKLLSLEESNTRYLLGYAISSDALGNTRDSLNAYKKVQGLGYMNLHVERFVEARIARLSIGDLAGATSW